MGYGDENSRYWYCTWRISHYHPSRRIGNQVRYKIHSMIFSEAGYSFSFLRLYYEHVVALFNQSTERAREIRKRIEAEYKSKGREYNKQNMERFHKVFNEVYPGYFRNSFLVSACSLFEHQMKKAWAFIQEEHNVPFAWEDFREPVPARMQKLLNFAGVALRDDPPRIELPPPDFKPTTMFDDSRIVINTLWEDLRYCYRLRNCIVHNNGLVHKARGSASIQEYASEKRILIEKEGVLEVQLNDSFNNAVCDTMQTFFSKLESAYYAAPLPQEPGPSDSSSWFTS